MTRRDACGVCPAGLCDRCAGCVASADPLTVWPDDRPAAVERRLRGWLLLGLAALPAIALLWRLAR